MKAIEFCELMVGSQKKSKENYFFGTFVFTSWSFRELYMGRLHRIDYDDPMAVNKAKNINWVTIYRVCGELALTRSIGDPDYKGFTPGERTDAFFLWPDGHNQIFHADLIIPDPEFKSKTLTEEDEFLILASDGLWDVVSPADAVKHVQ